MTVDGEARGGRASVAAVRERTPRDDHVVIERDEECGEGAGDTEAAKGGMDRGPRVRRRDLMLLAHIELEQEERDADDEEDERVRHEEGASTEFVAVEGESPKVAAVRRETRRERARANSASGCAA